MIKSKNWPRKQRFPPCVEVWRIERGGATVEAEIRDKFTPTLP